MDHSSTSVSAFLRPGVNAMQLMPSNSQRLSNTIKIQIELIIRNEQINNSTEEETSNSKQKSIEQINESCLAELKKELKCIFHTSAYSNVISDQTIKELIKLMP